MEQGKHYQHETKTAQSSRHPEQNVRCLRALTKIMKKDILRILTRQVQSRSMGVYVNAGNSSWQDLHRSTLVMGSPGLGSQLSTISYVFE